MSITTLWLYFRCSSPMRVAYLGFIVKPRCQLMPSFANYNWCWASSNTDISLTEIGTKTRNSSFAEVIARNQTWKFPLPASRPSDIDPVTWTQWHIVPESTTGWTVLWLNHRVNYIRNLVSRICTDKRSESNYGIFRTRSRFSISYDMFMQLVLIAESVTRQTSNDTSDVRHWPVQKSSTWLS
jgi:hypothetical protein